MYFQNILGSKAPPSGPDFSFRCHVTGFPLQFSVIHQNISATKYVRTYSN